MATSIETQSLAPAEKHSSGEELFVENSKKHSQCGFHTVKTLRRQYVHSKCIGDRCIVQQHREIYMNLYERIIEKTNMKNHMKDQ